MYMCARTGLYVCIRTEHVCIRTEADLVCMCVYYSVYACMYMHIFLFIFVCVYTQTNERYVHFDKWRFCLKKKLNRFKGKFSDRSDFKEVHLCILNPKT